MSKITICVPAFRSVDFIRHTLLSIQDQTYADYIVDISVEPGDQTAEKINHVIGHDARFKTRLNESVLGWSRNIGRLLSRVETPYFAILPHDDLWDPNYLATLEALLRKNPQASVAYADMSFIGASDRRKRVILDNQSLFSRLLSFYLQAPKAIPWRGVTRAGVLAGGRTFPHHDLAGFAVECEWAQHLLIQGEALRIDRPLYHKRLNHSNLSVTKGWRMQTEEWLISAVELHRTRMMKGLAAADITGPEKRGIILALELSVVRKYLTVGRGRFRLTESHRKRMKSLHLEIEDMAPSLRYKLRNRYFRVLSRDARIAAAPSP